MFTGLSPQSLIIDAGYDPWVSVDAVKHDRIETKKKICYQHVLPIQGANASDFPQQPEEQELILWANNVE